MQLDNPVYLQDGPDGGSAATTVAPEGGMSVVHPDRSSLVAGVSVKDAYYCRGFIIYKHRIWQAISAVLLFLFLVMVVVLSAKRQYAPIDTAHASAASTQLRECLQKDCVRQSSMMLSMMNLSVDPCQDFFSYACGNLESVIQDTISEENVRTLTDWMNYRNEEHVLRLLERSSSTKSATSSIGKAKNLFNSCMNEFENTKRSGALMVAIINDLGGLDLFGSWNESQWDLNRALIKMHSDHWTSTLWKFYWTPDSQNPGSNLLKIRKGSTALPFRSAYFDSGPFYAKYLRAYKSLISGTMSLLVGDSGVNSTALNITCGNSSCIDSFVEDVIHVESFLVNTSGVDVTGAASYVKRRFSRRREDPALRMTVEQLQQKFPQIEWRDLFKSLVGDSLVDASTPVMVPPAEYIEHVENLINSTTKRELHHFIVWNVLYRFLGYMGSDYTHQLFKFKQLVYRWHVPPSRESFCRDQLGKTMSQALALLFVRDHIGLDTVQRCTNFTNTVRKRFVNSLADWMDAGSKDTAEQLLESLDYHIGYLKWTMDEDQVDAYYRSLQVHKEHYFLNVKSIDIFRRTVLQNRLRDDDGKKKWKIDAWQAKVVSSLSRGILAVTAGAIKIPLYSGDLPEYVNLAGLGTLISDQLARFTVLPDDSDPTPEWWGVQTNSTLEQYRQCVLDLYRNQTIPFPNPIYSTAGRKINPSRKTSETMRMHQALQFAFREHERLSPSSQHLPGLEHTSIDRTFFLSFAQARCAVKRSQNLNYLFYRMMGEIPIEIRINTALYNHKHFAEAFECTSLPTNYPNDMCLLR